MKNLKSQLFFIAMHSVLSAILQTDMQMSARKILNFVLFMRHYSIWLKLIPLELVNRLSVVTGLSSFLAFLSKQVFKRSISSPRLAKPHLGVSNCEGAGEPLNGRLPLEYSQIGRHPRALARIISY